MHDNKMQPVWIHGVPDNVYSLNFRTQTYNGKPALSWWEGNLTPTGATLSGTDYVVNQNYKIVAKLTGQDGWVFSPTSSRSPVVTSRGSRRTRTSRWTWCRTAAC